MTNEQDWLNDFDVTLNDLHRIETWLNERKTPATLEEITRRVIRGRLRYGRDEGQSALPQWVKERQVLSWDEEDKWCVGCRVFVLRTIDGKVFPMFGIIKELTVNERTKEETYVIEFENGEAKKYGRVEPGSLQAKQRYDYLCLKVWEIEQAASGTGTLEQKIESIFTAKGALIGSNIITAMESDPRFSIWKEHWYLQAWIPVVNSATLTQIHRQLLKTTQQLTIHELLPLIPGLPQDELGELAINQALSQSPELFLPGENGWQIVPPPWENAVGAYYVYDPKTFEIILHPGERLKRKIADRLNELGFYAEVVEEES